MRRHLGAVLCALAIAACDEQTLVVEGPPLITLSATELPFGPVPVGATVERGLTVLNAGQLTLELTSARVTGADAESFGGAAAPLTLAKGEEHVWRITFSPQEERPYAATLVVESNADNAARKEVALTGIGVPSSACGPCDDPPPAGCLSEYSRIVWAETGTCVEEVCRYESRVESCAQGCDPATRGCRGVSYDAGAPDSAVADASPRDRAERDRARPDHGATDQGPTDQAAPDLAPTDLRMGWDANESCEAPTQCGAMQIFRQCPDDHLYVPAVHGDRSSREACAASCGAMCAGCAFYIDYHSEDPSVRFNCVCHLSSGLSPSTWPFEQGNSSGYEVWAADCQ